MSNLSLVGTYSYNINPAVNAVYLSANKILNSGTSSGTLRLELWLTEQQWNSSISNTGYEVATYQIYGPSNGTLSSNQYFSLVSATVPYINRPPAGTYYVNLVVAEYSGKYINIDNGYEVATQGGFDTLLNVDIYGNLKSIYKPTLTVKNIDTTPSSSILASSLIASIEDKNNYAITSYDFRDNTIGGGYFTLNGVKQAEGAWIQVTAANLPNLKFISAPGQGVDSVDVSVWDGYTWADYVNALVSSKVSISIKSTAETAEGDLSRKNLVFTLILSSPSSQRVSVTVDTVDDTAIAGIDYISTHSVVAFEPGQTEVSIGIPIIGNTIFQASRGFNVSLSNATGGVIDTNSSSRGGFIIDDDAPKNLILPNDPQYKYQWYLFNTRVDWAWQIASGKGVKIGVFDQGIDSNNPDLSANVSLALGVKALTLTPGGLPILSTDNHGTMVAGVIAAANDGKGIVGVAYDATLVSIYSNLSSSAAMPTEIANAYTFAKTLDILNDSWGFGNNFFSSANWAFYDNAKGAIFAPAFAALKNLADNGRNGLGTIVIQSSGNSFGYGDDTNLHNFQNSRYIITVASTDYFNSISSFSTHGASILISAPGGGGIKNYNSVLTTDRSGLLGLSNTDLTWQNGTSFSAPIVSGVVALMLEVNKNLGYRDIQNILAYTAKQINTGEGNWAYNHSTDFNGGGLHYNDNQSTGFGQIDALAAVRLAAAWNFAPQTSSNAQESIASKSVKSIIPDNSPTDGVHSSIIIKDSIKIERVEVSVNITHTYIGDLSIWITSPTGTTSNLLWRPGAGKISANGSAQDNINFTFDTVLDWGELSNGVWTLGVYDNAALDVGIIDSWTLDIVGKPATNSSNFIYTNEFPSIVSVNSTRAYLSDPTGVNDTINTAALGSDDRIDLTGSTPSVINGANLYISTVNNIKTAIGGDGSDVLICNSLSNNIFAGPGDDFIYSGRGNDIIDGGIGLDTVIFSGAFSSYLLRYDQLNGNYIITDSGGKDGSDVIKNVEIIKFTDKSVTLASLNLFAPTIALSTDKSSLIFGQTSTVVFTLSAASTNFIASDVTVSGGALSNFRGSGITYTATFTPSQNSNSNGVISVSSGAFTDVAGYANADGADADNTVTVSVDTLMPTIAVSSTKSSLIAGDTATLTFTLSEPSTNFIASDVTVSGGTLTGFAGSGTTYTATFTPTANSNANGVVSVASGVFTDAAGNVNADGTDANNRVTFVVNTLGKSIAGTVSNDNLMGSAGNDTIDGGTGIDTVTYGGVKASYKVTQSGGAVTVNSNADGLDILISVERLKFTDGNLALDLGANQSSGQTALLLGAILPGKLALDVSKQALLGSVIGLFDSGYSMPVLAGALLRLDIWSILTGQNISAASRTLAEDTVIVKYLLGNVYGLVPDDVTVKANAEVMHSETSQGSWLGQLALSNAGQNHIDLVGLSATGMAFV